MRTWGGSWGKAAVSSGSNALRPPPARAGAAPCGGTSWTLSAPRPWRLIPRDTRPARHDRRPGPAAAHQWTLPPGMRRYASQRLAQRVSLICLRAGRRAAWGRGRQWLGERQAQQTLHACGPLLDRPLAPSPMRAPARCRAPAQRRAPPASPGAARHTRRRSARPPTSRRRSCTRSARPRQSPGSAAGCRRRCRSPGSQWPRPPCA